MLRKNAKPRSKKQKKPSNKAGFIITFYNYFKCKLLY